MWKPENYTEPNWKPLEAYMLAAGRPVSDCGGWMWMYTDGGREHYKNRDTRAYLTLPTVAAEASCARCGCSAAEIEAARRADVADPVCCA